MARYRKIDVRMWADHKFRSLSAPKPNGRDCWVYLLTNLETTNIPGVYRAFDETLARGIGWSVEGFREAFREVSGKAMAKADWKAGLVFIPNVIKYDKPQSPNVVRSWAGEWDELPECELKEEARQHLKAFAEGFGEGYAKAFEEACRKPSPNPDPEPEPEPEPEKRAGRKDPLPFRIEDVIGAVKAAAGARIVVSPFPQKQSKNLTKLIRRFPDIGDWSVIGEWLAAGGERWRIDLGVGDLVSAFEKWLGLARVWRDGGRQPLASQPKKDPTKGISPLPEGY